MKIVYCDMVADLFHYGHVNFLRACKELGDFLIVGIHNDETVKSYKRMPILRMEERIKVVESCRYVDKVISDVPLLVTENFIKKHKIDIIAHSYKTNEIDILGMNDIPKKIGIYVDLKYTEDISTTDIINRIKKYEP